MLPCRTRYLGKTSVTEEPFVSEGIRVLGAGAAGKDKSQDINSARLTKKLIKSVAYISQVS